MSTEALPIRDPNYVERVRDAFAHQGFLRHVDVRVEELAPGRCVIAADFRSELAQQNGVAHHFNTAILVDKNAAVVGKYRKVHLPGHADNRPHYPFQHLEKRYFEPGDLGFQVKCGIKWSCW